MKNRLTALLLAVVTMFSAAAVVALSACDVKASPASSLSIDHTALTLGVGESTTLCVTGQKILSWKSSAKTVSVTPKSDSEAELTAEEEGIAVITARAENGERIACRVSVRPLAQTVWLNKDRLTIGVGETENLNSFLPRGAAGSRTYISSDPSVATVSEKSGIVTAKAKGETRITCRLTNGKEAMCTVTVKPLSRELTLSRTKVRLRIGGQLDLDSEIPSDCAALHRVYSSDRPEVAEVTASEGIVTAVKEGTARITCTLSNGTTADCEVEVMTPVESQSDAQGIITNRHEHNTYSGEDLWGKNTLEASMVDWIMGGWPCCSYFEGEDDYRCAEFGRYIRSTLGVSHTVEDYPDLTMTADHLRSVAKGCLPGSTLSFGPQDVPAHMIVLLKVTDDTIWWMDCNWNWDNLIHYRVASLEDFCNFVHWQDDPERNGYIVSTTLIDEPVTFSEPVTQPSRYRYGGAARIVWTKVDGAVSYAVYQAGGRRDKRVFSGAVTSYANPDSIPGTKYTYYVKAVMPDGTTVTGNKVSILGRLDAPRLELDRANRRITWNAVDGASGYLISRRIAVDGDFEEVATIRDTAYSEPEMDFTAGEYDHAVYRVRALSSEGEDASSVYSNLVAVSQEYCMP